MVCVNCDKKFNVNDEGGMFISYTNMMLGYGAQDLCGGCATYNVPYYDENNE